MESYFSKVCKVYEKFSIVGVFSNEFCEIFRKNYFEEHLWTTSSRLSYTKAVFTFSKSELETPEQCLNPV